MNNQDLIKILRAGDVAGAIALLNETPASLAQTMEVSHNLVAAQLTLGGVLVVAAPDGWDDVKRLVGKVIEYEGIQYAYSGWNSDRGEAYFKPSAAVARAY